ncbi:unnamed protein product, partial [Rotaria sordida]
MYRKTTIKNANVIGLHGDFTSNAGTISSAGNFVLCGGGIGLVIGEFDGLINFEFFTYYLIHIAREIACNVLAPAFTKIIEFIEQQDESADGLFANIKYVLESYELELEKLNSLGSDNTNVNVGNNHSVFSLFNELIPLLIQGNCYCHILHNSVQHGHDHLLFDIETAILKIYSHFCRSSVRSQELTKYFEFIDQEQKVTLQRIRTRWLSLLLSIERLIAIYPVVKSYFLNLKDGTCPKILLDFFTSHKGECTLFFSKNILSEVQEANILLQKHYITGVNLYSIIKDLLYKLNNRLRDDYFDAKVMELLEKIHDSNEVDDLKNEVDIEKLEWKNIEHCFSYIDDKKINKDLLYNDFNHLKSKFVQLKDKFGGINKQVQEFISSNLSLYKQGGTMSNDEVKLCSGGECDVEAEFEESDSSNSDIDQSDIATDNQPETLQKTGVTWSIYSIPVQ